MTNSILTALTTGKPIVLHAMSMREFAQLLDAIKGAKS